MRAPSNISTEELLSESSTSAVHRERNTFQESYGTRNLVLFGAGHLGHRVARALRRTNIRSLAFTDNNPALSGTIIEETPVMLPEMAVARWGSNALFLVTTYHPERGGVCQRVDELRSLGCVHISTFLPLAWNCSGILPHFGLDLPSRFLGNAQKLLKVSRLLTDDLSRQTFRRELLWRLHAISDGSTAPEPCQYFPRDIIKPNSAEVFVDCGAYDGDTFSNSPWPMESIIAFEPDPSNASRLRKRSAPHITIHEMLLGAKPGVARFRAEGSMASARSTSGSLEIPVTTIDYICQNAAPTFIKLDIEGDELIALSGAANTIRKHHPIVAVCLYHRPEDIWTLPLFLADILPEHRFFLRAHAYDGFELVLYAVPESRCVFSS
jgi:FkbM family methyltransferase